VKAGYEQRISTWLVLRPADRRNGRLGRSRANAIASTSVRDQNGAAQRALHRSSNFGSRSHHWLCEPEALAHRSNASGSSRICRFTVPDRMGSTTILPVWQDPYSLLMVATPHPYAWEGRQPMSADAPDSRLPDDRIGWGVGSGLEFTDRARSGTAASGTHIDSLASRTGESLPALKANPALFTGSRRHAQSQAPA
jgi:hypothetical protein